MDVSELESRLGHTFGAARLLTQALTHRSHSTTHNERLEFLGDSVLNCAVAHLLHERYTKLDEGDLSRLRSNLVKQQTLYEVAQRIELARFLRLGEGELKSGGFRRPSILADTMEALFGAIFLDGGFQAARAAIAKLYHPIMETVDPQTLGKDAKTLLQEYLQGRKIALPTYNVVATHGAAHNQEFEVECLIPKLDIRVTGGGASRRAAEQQAAKKALELSPKEAPRKTRRSRKEPAAEKSSPAAVSTTVTHTPAAPAAAASPEPAPKEAKDGFKRVRIEPKEAESAPAKSPESKSPQSKPADSKTSDIKVTETKLPESKTSESKAAKSAAVDSTSARPVPAGVA